MKKYTNPYAEMIAFNTEDIMSASTIIEGGANNVDNDADIVGSFSDFTKLS